MYNVAEHISCQFKSLRLLLDASPPLTLQEAHRPDVQTELLARATDVHRSNVHNRKSGSFLCPVLKHCLSPVTIGFLLKRYKELLQ